MARFEVGDRVMWGRDVCEVVLPHPDAAQRIIVMDDRGRRWTAPEGNLTPLPPPDPRDAVVEAAVAYIARHWPRVPPSSITAGALYDAVKAYQAAQT